MHLGDIVSRPTYFQDINPLKLTQLVKLLLIARLQTNSEGLSLLTNCIKCDPSGRS